MRLQPSKELLKFLTALPRYEQGWSLSTGAATKNRGRKHRPYYLLLGRAGLWPPGERPEEGIDARSHQGRFHSQVEEGQSVMDLDRIR
jgi:hypothetical protein